MSKLSLDLTKLVVDSFAPVPEQPVIGDPRLSAVVHSTEEGYCDTDIDCSTACLVPTNICRVCGTEPPDCP